MQRKVDCGEEGREGRNVLESVVLRGLVGGVGHIDGASVVMCGFGGVLWCEEGSGGG